MKRYRWDSAYEWLQEKSQEWDAETLRADLLDFALNAGNDAIQDMYQETMDRDGYFEKIEA